MIYRETVDGSINLEPSNIARVNLELGDVDNLEPAWVVDNLYGQVEKTNQAWWEILNSSFHSKFDPSWKFSLFHL